MLRNVFRSLVVLNEWLDQFANRSRRNRGKKPASSGRRKRRVAPVLEQLEARETPAATIVATSFFDSAVYEFDAGSGALKATLVNPNSSILSGPSGVAVGPDGNLYISSQFNDTIVRYNLATNSLDSTPFLTGTDLNSFTGANSSNVYVPANLQFGPDGDLYVCLDGNQGAGAVVKFNISVSVSGGLTVATPGTSIGTGWVAPTGMTFGTALGDTHNLYVSDPGVDDVVKINNVTSATPTVVAPAFITAASIPPASGTLYYPTGVTWGQDGKFYLTDVGGFSFPFQGNIFQFNANGSFSNVVTPTVPGQPGNLQLQFPSATLFDGQGHFYTANLGMNSSSPLAGSINEYNTDGTFNKTLVSSSQFPDPGTGNAGIAPSQMVFLPTPAPLVVATSFFDSAVYEFDSRSGALKATLVAPGSTQTTLSGPSGVTLGTDGQLYISSQFNDTVVRYNLTANTLNPVPFLSGADLNSFTGANSSNVYVPANLQFGPDGNLYVCLDGNQGAGAVVRFNITQGAGGVLSVATPGTAIGTGWVTPTGLTFGPAGDTSTLYVSDPGKDDVVKVLNATSATPTVVSPAFVTAASIPAASGALYYPTGITWGPDGRFYVTDVGGFSFPFQGNVFQFNSNGSFSAVVTPTGPGQTGNLQFQFPSQALFDGSGHLLTANLGAQSSSPLAGSINEYDTDGAFDKVLVSGSQVPPTPQGNSGVSTSQLILIPAPAVVTHFVISSSSSNVTAGGTVNITVSADDSSNNPVPGYIGTISLSSTDGNALWNGLGLPASYTFTSDDAGTHTFTVTLKSAGTQTLTATDKQNSSLAITTGPITVTPGALNKFVVTVLNSSFVPASSFVAGNSFLVTAQAVDQFGNFITSYGGQSNITLSAGPVADPLSNFPVPGTISSNGFAFFLGTLKTVGTYTLTATAGSVSGTAAVSITPASASYLTLVAPTPSFTGNAVNVTATAFDKYGNVATGYTGAVKLTSTDAAATLGNNYTFTSGGAGQDNGIHTFSVILATAGNQKVTATDTTSTNPAITGTSNTVAVAGLVVTSVTPTPNGFTVTFNKAFIPGDIALYGANKNVVADVVLTGDNGVNAIHGSLLIDPSNQSFIFKATTSYLQLKNSLANPTPNYNSVVLPDATYTVKLISGSGTNGFLDALGAGLDGAGNGGHANYTTTFTTHFQANATPVLGIPDFARGPDNSLPIAVPTLGAGIPITLYNAANVTDVTFSLNYNPSLLNITATRTGAGSDANDPAATLSLVSNAGGVATFHYVDTNPVSATPTSPLVLGDLVAVVPSGAGAAALGLYQVKELLHLSNIVINNGLVTGAVSADGIHVNAYFGDVTGDKVIDGLDKLAADNVAQGRASGFSAFTQLDPAIIGDVAGDFSVDAGDVSTIDSYVAKLNPLQIPRTPTQLTTNDPNYVDPSTMHSPNAADPTLSLVSGEGLVVSGGHNSPLTTNLSLSVMIDEPDPAGSTGLTSATLALAYDPSVVTVSSADITLGDLPGQESGWQIISVVDQASGQIGIQLYSPRSITATQAGSLVNITFHLNGEPTGVSPQVMQSIIQLVNAATPNGQWFGTSLADAEGALILGPGIATNYIGNMSPNTVAIAPLVEAPNSIVADNRRADAAPLVAAGHDTEAAVTPSADNPEPDAAPVATASKYRELIVQLPTNGVTISGAENRRVDATPLAFARFDMALGTLDYLGLGRALSTVIATSIQNNAEVTEWQWAMNFNTSIADGDNIQVSEVGSRNDADSQSLRSDANDIAATDSLFAQLANDENDAFGDLAN